MKAAFQIEEPAGSKKVRAVVKDVEMPTLEGLPKGMMIVKTVVTSICGSDLWGKGGEGEWRGVIDHFWAKKGCVGGSGHEVLGEVINVNKPCRTPVGTLVLCMTTNYLQGVDSVAEEFEQTTGYPVKNLPSQGSFCEYFLTYDALTIPVPARTPCPTFSRLHYIAAQPLGTVLHALKRLPSIVGKKIVVVGQGQNGLIMTKMLSLMAVKKIVAVDLMGYRLDMAKKLGADSVVSGNAVDVEERITKALGGKADITLEMVGHQSRSLDIAAAVTKNDGVVLVFGLPPAESSHHMTIRFGDFARNVRYITTHAPSMATFGEAMELLESGKLTGLNSVFTHRFDFKDFPTAYDLAANYKSCVVKTLVTFPGHEKHLKPTLFARM
eukprot:TRINITY_DN21182_c3_g1_i1.p1 TRINITY_DN21182_c3_g1~~TRINITY_DN21182_c3_g1_i1.p1  ORF type:complete len:381 (+),score=45.41 TRINITY_DN21182_c3_g1_i1:80-1222(+)